VDRGDNLPVMIVRQRVPSHVAHQWTGDNKVEIAKWMQPRLIDQDGDELIIENRSGRSRVRLNEWIIHIDYNFVTVSPAVFDVLFEGA